MHGPWGIDGYSDHAAWEAYWRDDDALFRTEVGVAGASPPAMIRRFAGHESYWPPTTSWWRHTAAWWTHWPRLEKRSGVGLTEERLDCYVNETQHEYLATAARWSKVKFPACDGFVVWMGHDAFPCPSNTSLLDFDGVPKPAAHALRSVFTSTSTAPDL